MAFYLLWINWQAFYQFTSTSIRSGYSWLLSTDKLNMTLKPKWVHQHTNFFWLLELIHTFSRCTSPSYIWAVTTPWARFMEGIAKKKKKTNWVWGLEVGSHHPFPRNRRVGKLRHPTWAAKKIPRYLYAPLKSSPEYKLADKVLEIMGQIKTTITRWLRV